MRSHIDPGSSSKFLHDNGVNVIVSGGMGGRAIQFFHQYGIRVVLGAAGSVDGPIETILKVNLKTSQYCTSRWT